MYIAATSRIQYDFPKKKILKWSLQINGKSFSFYLILNLIFIN